MSEGDDVKRYVVGFAFDQDEQKVLLILKTHPEWQAGRFNGVGGHIEPSDETPLAAMDREFREETDGVAESWRAFAHLIGRGFEVYFFRGVVAGGQRCMGAEGETTAWFRVDNLPENVLPNLRWLIPMARSRQAQDWPFRVYERMRVDA
jgi:8-oxo-dGTP diphosphatase